MPAFFSPKIDRFVSAFFVGTLIFCHGVFGAFHITSDAAIPPAGEHAKACHPSSAHGGPVSEDRPASHHADAEYFAVLLGIFLGGSALWLLLQNDRWLDGTSSTWRSVSSPSVAIPNLPRGPTLPFLQVLRL
jgi:hypothetical protein